MVERAGTGSESKPWDRVPSPARGEEAVMRRHVALMSLVVLVLVSCSPPPPPSAETVALEGSLLAREEVDGGFEEDSRGQVGVGGGGICGEADFRFEDIGAVRVSFIDGTGDGEPTELTEMMYVVPDEGIADMMRGLKDGFQACDGVVWTDYGTTQTVEVIEAPGLGDDSFAVTRIEGEPPFDTDTFESTTFYVAKGDVFIELSTDVRAVGEAEFLRIATIAVDKVPR
jgi:hypothetical protein